MSDPLGDFASGGAQPIRNDVLQSVDPTDPAQTNPSKVAPSAPSQPTPSSPTSPGRPRLGAGGHEVLGMEGRPALVSTPTPTQVADAVPDHAAQAVAMADRKAAPQPDVREKRAATERMMAGEEPEGTVVEGIEDDTLWVMLRKFNKQVNHVLHPATSLPPAEPDLRQTNLPNVPYRSDTLKANLERLIMGLAPPATRGVQELMRLTDWEHEFWRTAAYCTAYFVAWAFGAVVLGATGFFIVLICFPRTRRILFPYVSCM